MTATGTARAGLGPIALSSRSATDVVTREHQTIEVDTEAQQTTYRTLAVAPKRLRGHRRALLTTSAWARYA